MAVRRQGAWWRAEAARFFYRRDREPARFGQFRRVLRGQARIARVGAVHGARTRPEAFHVAHVVVDGAIDTEFIRENFPERYATRSE